MLPLRVLPAAALAFAIGALIEFGQGVNLLDLLGMRDNEMIAVVLGGSFEWLDFVAYAAGALIALMVERFIRR